MQQAKGFFYQKYLEAKVLNTKALIRLYYNFNKKSAKSESNFSQSQNKKVKEFSDKFLNSGGLFL
ncbi:MAG: hypothetical protein N3D10_00500 [Candidatus Micrarchaeota archaeon]|nr:hypothetical protein [Candidatus Micrarchaeota archaeon]